jgi:hypothetical protein
VLNHSAFLDEVFLVVFEEVFLGDFFFSTVTVITLPTLLSEEPEVSVRDTARRTGFDGQSGLMHSLSEDVLIVGAPQTGQGMSAGTMLPRGRRG